MSCAPSSGVVLCVPGVGDCEVISSSCGAPVVLLVAEAGWGGDGKRRGGAAGEGEAEGQREAKGL
jgi:exo-beta-1,3-glucanase (GH17 family)